MRRYEVVWEQTALDQLAQLWLEASNRNAMALATDRIDEILATAPLTAGEELHEGLRGLTVLPLRVLFYFVPADNKVKVTAVRAVS